MLHSDLKAVKCQRLQGQKKVVLTNTEIQALGEKTEALGAHCIIKTSSCRHCSNIVLTCCYLLHFNLFSLAILRRGWKSHRPQSKQFPQKCFYLKRGKHYNKVSESSSSYSVNESTRSMVA